jgi:phage terminase large subunit
VLNSVLTVRTAWFGSSTMRPTIRSEMTMVITRTGMDAMIAAAAQLANWREHPVDMVRQEFGIEPDAWQIEVLEAFPHHQRIAMKACKGPGKTAVEAWLAWNFLLTRPHPKCAATSITGDNLRDNFWTEMAKWRAKSPLLQRAFEWTKSRIFNRESPETWFMSARTWPRDADASKQSETLAGLHADYILFILDESGGIPDTVMVAAEAALSSCVEGHIVQAGNPSMLAGPLYRASTSERRLWFVVEVTGDPDDPKRSSRISVQWAREQIEKYGRDNPWVLVNVFGKFPPSSLNVLIGVDEVTEAMKRYRREYEIGDAARVLGVDVARFGDDASIIFKRQGIQAFPILKYRNINSTQGAGQVSREWQDWNADAAFINDTGGFGSGWIDQLRQLGRYPVGVHFAGEAHDKARYVNKRAEMYFDAVEWIKRGGALPESPELLAALTQTTYTFQADRFLLEPKDQVKIKIGYSPDEADAFALTFAEPVWSKTSRRHRNTTQAEWVPPWIERDDA